MFENPSNTKNEDPFGKSLGTFVLQSHPVPLTKKEIVSPPAVSPLLSGKEEIPRIKPSKLPNYKMSTPNFKKSVYLHSDGNE